LTGDHGEAPFQEHGEHANAPLRALEHPRFEIVPIEGAREQARYLPPGAEVTITCSPTLGIENTLALAEEFAEQGFRVVPHVSARLVKSEGHLQDILLRLGRSGLRDAFVVGGDVKEPVGPFRGGVELLAAMAKLGHGVERIGMPAYPEGHPFIPEEELMRALLEKQRFASYAVTQICFEAGAILGWIEHAREAGVELPVYVGIPGVVERGRLLRISLKIGLGTSVRYLKKQHGWVGHLMLHGSYSPEHLIEDLSPYVGDSEYGIHGFHINTFNQAENTERWRRALLASAGNEGA
jgi:methylenetetrahydrofolate reductase (NADPH)